MDANRFDRLAAVLADPTPRRTALRLAFGAAFGAGAFAVAPPDDAGAKKCGRGKKKCNGTCIKKSKPCVPADRCANVAVCNAPYVGCGTTAVSGELCSCERTVEGNTACINFIESCDGLVPCTSTDGPEATSCRKQVGFHFFCQAPKGCGCGQVCLPECDNPS